jgi:FkbM family methyltransferase
MTFHVFDPWVTTVAGKYGPILANSFDEYVGQSLIEYGDYSEGEVDLLAALIEPGQTVIEVGANVGALTLPMAKLLGPHGTLIAVEPQRHCFQMLCGTLALNHITNTRAIWAACNDHSQGFIRVPRFEPTQPANFGGVTLRQDTPSGELVWSPTIYDLLHTLDLLGPVHFLKLDVEGMEPAVLRGAEALFSLSRPICYVECDRPDTEAPIRAQFAQWQYDLWWHLPPLFRTPNCFGNTENIWGKDVVSVNLLCVPSERAYQPPAAWECLPVANGSPHSK